MLPKKYTTACRWSTIFNGHPTAILLWKKSSEKRGVPPHRSNVFLRVLMAVYEQVWKREAHATKANTVHAHPTSRHLFATVSVSVVVED